MLIDVDSGSRITRPAHVDPYDYLDAARGVDALGQDRLHRTREVAGRMSDTSAGFRRAVADAVGQERYAAYRSGVAEALGRLRATADTLPRDVDGFERLDAQRLRLREEVGALRAELGIDPATLAGISAERQELCQSVLSFPEPVDGATPSLVVPGAVPSELLTGRTNPWQLFEPPYDGSAWDYSWSRRGGIDPILRGVDNATTGQVGSLERTWDDDASDADYLHLDYHNAVGAFVGMPQTGLVESWVELQSIASYHQFFHTDEWGWSDGWGRVGSRVTMQVVSPEASGRVGAWALDVQRSGTDFSDWRLDSYVTGGTYWAHLYSDRVYSAGRMLYVLFGSHEFTHEAVNDVSYNDQVTYEWFIRRIWVRSTGE